MDDNSSSQLVMSCSWVVLQLKRYFIEKSSQACLCLWGLFLWTSEIGNFSF